MVSKHNVSFSCVYQRDHQCARMRPVIGVSPLLQSANQRRGSRGRWKQPVLSAAPERGRREDMEIHIANVFSTLNHWYIILRAPIPQIKSQEGVKYGAFNKRIQKCFKEPPRGHKLNLRGHTTIRKVKLVLCCSNLCLYLLNSSDSYSNETVWEVWRRKSQRSFPLNS